MKKALKKAKEDTSKTLRKAEQDARPTVDKIDDSLHDAEKRLRPTLHKVDDALHDAEKDLRPVVKKAGDDISDVAHQVERGVRHFIRGDRDDGDDKAQGTRLSDIQQELGQPNTLTVGSNSHSSGGDVVVPLVFTQTLAVKPQDSITAKNDAFREYHFGQQNPKREENLCKFRASPTEPESETVKKALVRFATYSDNLADSLEYDAADSMEVDTVIQTMVREMEASKLRVN